MTTIIRNACIVTDGERFVGSVAVSDGRIAEIGRGKDAALSLAADAEIDADGLFLLPGIIDEHVHFRTPGMTHKGDIFSESRAAAAGGVTTFLDMPNTKPATTTAEALAGKMKTARRDSLVNYGFYIGATNDNAALLRDMETDCVAGIKIFMGASTGNMLVDGSDALERLFGEARLPVVVHCEEQSVISRNTEAVRNEWGDDAPVRLHSVIRSEEACLLSTRKALDLATRFGTRLHVAHVSTAAELDLFRNCPEHITAEICPAYLLFSADDYARLGGRIKCNPALKTEADRQRLLQAVANGGEAYCIGTDHAPHRLREKEGGCLQAASGMPLVQFSLVAMLSLVSKGVLTIERLAELMCHHPAELFGISERGFVREGYHADLVLVRPHSPWTLTPNRIVSRCNWSPLEGRTFDWQVERTYVNGITVFANGDFVGSDCRGQAVTYVR